jgi:hypothetical protein
MALSSSSRREAVAWVRELNSQWIVHNGLERRAEAYIAHLAATAPARLDIACRRAARLVFSCEPSEDPKPWFYAGLFSVPTIEEAEQYLADHWFTAQCVPAVADHSKRWKSPDEIGPQTEAKIARVRNAVAELD